MCLAMATHSMIQEYGLDPARVAVLRNAIGPSFEGRFRVPRAAKAKGTRLSLSYTSTPFRGLDVLLTVFPQVRAEFPAAELAVYSSMKVYQQASRMTPSLRCTSGAAPAGSATWGACPSRGWPKS